LLAATIFAIIYGPVKAVKITRDLDTRREERTRKYSILSDLMKTRRARLDPLHVAALNLVELEFYEAQDVKNAFENYVAHLNSHFPIEPDASQRHHQKSDDLFSELLRLIAIELGYHFDKSDLNRRSYLPQGLGRHHEDAMMNAALLREVLEGRRPVPITNFAYNPNLFPPPPKEDGTL
jgi:hypothetical protein